MTFVWRAFPHHAVSRRRRRLRWAPVLAAALLLFAFLAPIGSYETSRPAQAGHFSWQSGAGSVFVLPEAPLPFALDQAAAAPAGFTLMVNETGVPNITTGVSHSSTVYLFGGRTTQVDASGVLDGPAAVPTDLILRHDVTVDYDNRYAPERMEPFTHLEPVVHAADPHTARLPSPRYGAEAVTVTDQILGHRIFIVGGTDGTRYFNEIVEFDPFSERVVNVHRPCHPGNSLSNMGQVLLDRVGHNVIYNEGYLYVFGGRNDHGLARGYHAIDLNQLVGGAAGGLAVCKEHYTQQARHGGATSWDPRFNVGYVFGGDNGAGPQATILRLTPNPGLGTLAIETVTGPAGAPLTLPSARTGASAVHDPTPRPGGLPQCPGGCSYVFGGQSVGGLPIDQVVAFDPILLAATVVGNLPQGPASPLTAGQVGPGTTAAFTGQYAYVYGGRDPAFPGGAGAPNNQVFFSRDVVRYNPWLPDQVVEVVSGPGSNEWELAVEWTEPAYEGAVPIVGYLLQRFPEDAPPELFYLDRADVCPSQALRMGPPPIHLTDAGLQTHGSAVRCSYTETYNPLTADEAPPEFRLRAYNDMGAGLWSWPRVTGVGLWNETCDQCRSDPLIEHQNASIPSIVVDSFGTVSTYWNDTDHYCIDVELSNLPAGPACTVGAPGHPGQAASDELGDQTHDVVVGNLSMYWDPATEAYCIDLDPWVPPCTIALENLRPLLGPVLDEHTIDLGNVTIHAGNITGFRYDLYVNYSWDPGSVSQWVGGGGVPPVYGTSPAYLLKDGNETSLDIHFRLRDPGGNPVGPPVDVSVPYAGQPVAVVVLNLASVLDTAGLDPPLDASPFPLGPLDDIHVGPDPLPSPPPV